MERELKDYLDQKFAKLATKEEVNSLRGELKGEVNSLRGELREEVNSLRGELKGLEDRVLHEYHITAEALRDDIKVVAEGVVNLNEKFSRDISQFRKEVAYSHDDLKAMIKFSYSELDKRLTTLEMELENLRKRVEKIEASARSS